MKRGQIVISDSGCVTVHSVNGKVWLSKHQIAELFGVYVSTIHTNIRSILKSGVVYINIYHEATVMGNTVFPDLYDWEMITALAFRINSVKASFFREWVLKKIVEKPSPAQPQILISIERNREQYSN